MEKLLDSNFVYFAVYFTFMASIGQYIVWKKISTFCHNVYNAFTKAKKVVSKQRKAQVIDTTAIELVPDVRFKVNQKACRMHLEQATFQRQVDAGMHDLTSKFNRKQNV